MPLSCSAAGSGGVDTASAGSSIYPIATIGASNLKGSIRELAVGFSGASATDKPYLVQIVRHTGTLNTSTALTERVLDSQDTATPQIAAHENITFTGGAETVLWETTVHPQTRWAWSPPFGMELNINTSETIAVKVTTQTGGTGSIKSYGAVVWQE
jgi:hypothetical protein